MYNFKSNVIQLDRIFVLFSLTFSMVYEYK